MYILYSTNEWHDHSSKKVLGIFKKKEFLVSELKSALRKTIELDDLSEDDENSLLTIDQTQGRTINFLIEEYELNKLEL
jgi:hypothetical protein